MGDPSIQPRYQALYRACIKDAAVAGAALMQATLQRALQDLPQAAAGLADVVERNLLLEAAAVLREQRAALADAYPQALLAEVAQAIAGDRGSVLSFDSLPLLADDQLQDNVDVVRAAHVLQEAVAPELAALEALFAAAGVLPVGGQRRHPLRPEVYVRSLVRATRQSPVSPAVRRRWLRHLPASMAPALARSYATLSGQLQAQGLAAAPAAPAPPDDRATQLTIRELRKLLAGEPGDGADEAVIVFAESDFSHTVPSALEMVQDMRKVDQVLQQLRLRHAAMPGNVADHRAAFREAVRREAHTPAQALGLEVVHQMVEHLAGDPRLLPEVQETVRDLEPALLRLALADPRFFSDRSHPGRQLLEQVTQRSLAWSSAEGSGFRAFLDGLEQAVEALLETRATGAQPFEIALEALQEAWTEAQPRARRSRERAVRALLRAEQRNLLAERLAAQIRARPDAQAAPAEALAFLTGPWAQVLAQARLVDDSGDEDPGGFGALVQTVLWSVQPPLAARVTAQPAFVVERIAAGLATIEHAPADTQRWLTVLRQLRTLALFASGGAQGGPISQPAPLPATSDTWLAPVEASESGFVPEPDFATGDEAGDGESLPPLDLQVGAWVEMPGEQGQRWQLAWASPHGLLFMFAQANGATRSMTRRRLQQMIAAGAVRLVSTRAVVDGALDAVARAAWRNSV
jgi:hypothetical protein